MRDKIRISVRNKIRISVRNRIMISVRNRIKVADLLANARIVVRIDKLARRLLW